MQRGMFGTTPRTHYQGRPVKVYLEEPDEETLQELIGS